MSNIKLFESKKIRTVWNETDQKWYFSVADVVQGLTDTSNPADYIKKMRKRDEELSKGWGQFVTPLLIDTEGGKQKVNCANAQGLLRIIQGEASTTEIAKNKNVQGFIDNRKAAIAGGNVAGKARQDLERKSGKEVVSKENFKQLSEKEKRQLNKGKSS